MNRIFGYSYPPGVTGNEDVFHMESLTLPHCKHCGAFLAHEPLERIQVIVFIPQWNGEYEEDYRTYPLWLCQRCGNETAVGL